MEGSVKVKKAFTLLELILAVTLLGVMTAVTFATFRAVTNGWRVSREYVDRLERTDYAIDQLVSALKCAWYPHSGSGQDYAYGFQLTDNGDGERPDDSDVIEWTKTGSALVGNGSSGDTVHRVQVMILEKGDRTWGDEVDCTGLYARVKPLAEVIPDDSSDDDEFTFANDELYRPILIAKDIEGFNCRVQAVEPDDSGKKEDKDAYEDEFEASNSVPYKVQMTFYMLKEDPQYASQKTRVPIMRVVRMPIHEQSLDNAALPGEKEGSGSTTSGGNGGGE